jgi:hypothetical protein
MTQHYYMTDTIEIVTQIGVAIDNDFDLDFDDYSYPSVNNMSQLRNKFFLIFLGG